jgi:hypothetical protein
MAMTSIAARSHARYRLRPSITAPSKGPVRGGKKVGGEKLPANDPRVVLPPGRLSRFDPLFVLFLRLGLLLLLDWLLFRRWLKLCRSCCVRL